MSDGRPTWAFTFSWAAVASTTLSWIGAGEPAGSHLYSYLVLAAITMLLAAITARTVLAVARRQLLPQPATASLEPTVVPTPAGSP